MKVRLKNLLGVAAVGMLVGACGEVDVEHSTSKSICGRNDLQHVAFYDGRISGLKKTFVAQNEGPVGAMVNTQGFAYCSGTLVGRRTFLTAAHCVDANPVSVAFNFQFTSDGDNAGSDFYRIERVIEKRKGGLDYALVELEGNPGDKWGITALSDDIPARGSHVTVIQHPAGQRKQVHAGPVSSTDQESITYAIDTLGGSSGSGVLNQDGKLLAVHTNGGCGAESGANFGILIRAIAKVSSVINN